jgi:hypothetical protein
MKSPEKIEKLIRNVEIGSNPDVNQVVLENLLKEFDVTDRQQKASVALPNKRRILMKSPITKIAAAAAIILAVGFGLFEFIDNESGSGVVWAEVIKNVEASPGVIFRIMETGKGDLNEQWPNGYRVMQRNATLSRMDWYRGDQIHRTVYFDLVGKTKIWVAHDVGVYSKETMSDESIEKVRGNEGGWTNPQALINFCLTHARERKELGQKMIDDVLCEGMEGKAGSDGSNPPAKSFVGRLWVSVETGFPVRLEIEAIGENGSIRETSTIDQFQWNADLSPENVEPEIPADYEPLR